jgi:long-chain acyl-CoA synthetase
MIEPASFSVRKAFSGKGVLLTGSTGFVAKAVAEKILRDLRDVGQIFVLIRPRVKADGSRVDPRDRLREEILRNTAFRLLREQLGDEFESFCDSKITCVPGDLTHDRLGLDAAAYSALTKKVDIVIHSAATVKFDERLDLALDLNTLGPQRLLDLARASDAIYVHVSTAYVSGRRTGLCPERLVPPLEAIDAQLPPGVARPERFDVVEEITRLNELARSVRADCELSIKQKDLAPDSEDANALMQTALVGAGMRRAQSLGWNDTYTYTKYLGEQLLKIKHQKVPTVIVRPSIVESTLREPEPGWLDTLRMADPIIIGFGKGRLADFPASQSVVLDIIPLDLVVNGILSAAAYISTKPAGFDLFQIASSSENPLVFRSLYEHVRDYFQKHPMTDRSGKPVMVPNWKFPTVDQYRRRMRNRYLRPIRAATMVLDGPFTVPGTRKMRSRLRTLNTTLEQLLYYVDIYGPYVNLQCRFETVHSRELLEALRPDERSAFDFDPRKIRWKNYLQDVHIPGIKRNILRMESVPSVGAGQGHLLDEEGEAAKKRGSSSVRGVPQTVVDLCARGAERFGNRPIAEIRRINPETQAPVTTRLTYADLFKRSGELARVLIARLGLHPGDRIALIGENCPEWPLMYMAISRACCTVVPLDRMMAPADAARLIKLVDAKAVITSPAIMKAAQDHLGMKHELPPCLNMLADLAPFAGEAWTYPEASIGERPLKDPSPETLASIIFTSGTTRDPKGVMLSHGNVVADALSVAEVLEPMESDRFLSVLPLNHAFEFTCDFLIPMYGGSTIHYVENLKDVADTMKLAEITVVLGVPRLFKLFMDKIKASIESTGTTGKISVRIGKTMANAWEMAGAANPRKRIFKKVHDAFGGQLRLFVSGGAALDPEIFTFFKNFGINIVEGYGLTETAPVLAVNPIGAPKASSVGPAVPGVELRINQPDSEGIGEVFARGPTIMQGYWRNPAATEKSFEGGWFKSGDLGRIDKDGYLHITGRLKDVIVTAAGKNVYPDEVESALSDIAGVKELCVLGMPARSGHGRGSHRRRRAK